MRKMKIDIGGEGEEEKEKVKTKWSRAFHSVWLCET
jgi:hypothetical protein